MADFCGQCAKTDCGICAAYKKYVADEKKKKEEEKQKEEKKKEEEKKEAEKKKGW